MEAKNAKIDSTMLGREDHGIMTCMLFVNYGGACQGFGGYTLDGYDKGLEKRVGSAYGMEFIIRVLETVGVTRWEELPGKHLRVKADHGKIHSIGNIIEDKWFAPEPDLSEFIRRENENG